MADNTTMLANGVVLAMALGRTSLAEIEQRGTEYWLAWDQAVKAAENLVSGKSADVEEITAIMSRMAEAILATDAKLKDAGNGRTRA